MHAAPHENNEQVYYEPEHVRRLVQDAVCDHRRLRPEGVEQPHTPNRRRPDVHGRGRVAEARLRGAIANARHHVATANQNDKQAERADRAHARGAAAVNRSAQPGGM